MDGGVCSDTNHICGNHHRQSDGVGVMAVKNKARSQGRYLAQPIIGRSIAVEGDVFYFSSMQEAKEQGFHPQTISLCLKGKLSQTGGFTWERWE